MKLIEELIPLRLYPAKRKLWVPFSDKDKRHGSAIFLMGPNQESNEKLMNLPYLYDPSNLFRSYYVDRNVMAYIKSDAVNDLENEEYDEVQEAVLSEGMFHTEKAKVKYIDASTMDERKLKAIYSNDRFDATARMIGLRENPIKELNVVVHSNAAQLQREYHGDEKVYSFSNKNEIHLISYLTYDEDSMDGPYDAYCQHELIYCMILNGYNAHPTMANAVAIALSGQIEWLREKKNKPEFKYYSSDKEHIDNIYMADLIRSIYETKKSAGIRRLLNGNVSDLQAIAGGRIIRDIKKLYKTYISEGTLTAEDRKSLKDSDYGLPDKKKYPMPDADHVRAAIRMFNHVNSEDEAELASAIKRKMKKFGVKADIGENNRLSKYIHESTILTEITSTIDKDFKKKESIKLSSLKKVPLSSSYIKIKKSDYPHLKHVSPNDDKYTDSYAWENDGDIVAVLAVRSKEGSGDDHTWIQDIWINDDYRGHGLSKQILDYATKNLKANALGVDDKNKVAEKIYKDYGFKFGDDFDPKEKNHCMYLESVLTENTVTVDGIPGIDLDQEGNYLIANHSKEYYDVLTILADFSKEEFDKISFNSTYKDSPYIEKRIIMYDVNERPKSFMDVYHFPSDPDVAYITTAVGISYRGDHLATTMFKALLDSGFAEENNIKRYIWHVNPDNHTSAVIAKINKFKFLGEDHMDKYGRYTYVYDVAPIDNDDIAPPMITAENAFMINETDGFIFENLDDPSIFNEVDSKYDMKMKRYLYKERIKNNRSVMTIYDQVKARNPKIKRTYRNIKLYKGLNVYVDTSYYHEMYLKNAMKGTRRALFMYVDFLNRLMENENISKNYRRITYFFPIEKTREANTADALMDWSVGFNPLSIIDYLLRKSPESLKPWANKEIVFFGENGYFKVDFGTLTMRNRNRLKRNVRKLLSGEVIVDEEPDEDDDIPIEDGDPSTKAIATNVIDTIEKKSGIQINDISPINSTIKINHLSMEESIPNIDPASVAIMIIGPDSESIVSTITDKSLKSKEIRGYYKAK